ncbi:MAG: PaaI family thioesterase [Eubacteriales bacterium]|nr:PaaI family thioesterase [Eubacteriales bacterium]
MIQDKIYHEQRLRVAINRRTQAEPGSVNNRIPPEFISCSEDGHICTIRYRLKPEMRNPMGWLHGGVISAMVDMGMGLLVYYNADFLLCPTASMTVNFLRPGRIDGCLVVQSEITFHGHKIFHTTARAWMEDEPEKLVCTATGSYIVTPKAVPLKEKKTKK